MCGIAGELNYSSKTRADWEHISELMVRRGPDDSGSWHDESCHLVFRRLAIIDLSQAGHQPMISSDGRYILVFNGELYNYQSLRKVLEQRGIRFRSNTDTEVVLYSLIEWGCIDAINRFNGMFALGFYDTHEKKLFLARDHAGIKPLYWMRHKEGIMFASQYDQILAHPWSKNLSFSSAASTIYLHLGFVPAPYGILEDTHMLEPGSWLQVDSKGNIKSGCYYEIPYKEQPTLFGQNAMEAVNAAIAAAVKRQLVSDVPVGAFLSGGIDSPLICAKMQEVSDVTMRAFTIGTGGDETDESLDAARYAQELGIEQTLVHVNPDDAINMLDDVVKSCGEPFGDFSIFPTLLVSRLARQNFTVMLSGDGGDELFWGYAGRFSSVMSGVNDFKLPWMYRRLIRIPRRILGIKQRPSSYHQSIGQWQRDKLTKLPHEWLYKVFPEMPEWPKEYSDFDYQGSDPDEAARWIRRNEFINHLSGVLLKVDRASMYNSLEVRVPLLDREVIDVAMQVDWKTCFDMPNRLGKIPLRKSLARHLDYQTTAKKGFAPPMGRWLRTSLRQYVEEKFLTRENLGGILINRNALYAMYKEHLDGRDMGWGLWSLVSFALWQCHYER